MKATVLAESSLYFIFSPGYLCYCEVYRFVRRCRTLPFFLTIFITSIKKRDTKKGWKSKLLIIQHWETMHPNYNFTFKSKRSVIISFFDSIDWKKFRFTEVWMEEIHNFNLQYISYEIQIKLLTPQARNQCMATCYVTFKSLPVGHLIPGLRG